MASTVYHEIPFHLISAKERYDFVAEIRTDGDVMVINVPEDDGPYLIRGKRAGSFFAGVDEIEDNTDVDLVARWCELGDVWVGYWREDGEEFLFSFHLPKTSGRKPAKRVKRT